MMVHKPKHSLKVISFYTKDDSVASDPAWWATHTENLDVKTFTSEVADVVVIGQWSGGVASVAVLLSLIGVAA